MRAALVLFLTGGVSGCVQLEPSGHPLVPVPVSGSREAPAPPSEPEIPQGSFDFEAEDRRDLPPGGVTDPVALQARMLGVPLSEVQAPSSSPASSPAATATTATTATAATAAAAAAATTAAGGAPAHRLASPVWDPTKPLADTSFGVRVVATLLEIQPPRAVIALPDGSEQVVQPGTMLTEHSMVILAIGQDAVQIARILPRGFYAAVETETIRSLYPGAAPAER